MTDGAPEVFMRICNMLSAPERNSKLYAIEKNGLILMVPKAFIEREINYAI
jgi:hypothetical protein